MEGSPQCEMVLSNSVTSEKPGAPVKPRTGGAAGVCSTGTSCAGDFCAGGCCAGFAVMAPKHHLVVRLQQVVLAPMMLEQRCMQKSYRVPVIDISPNEYQR